MLKQAYEAGVLAALKAFAPALRGAGIGAAVGGGLGGMVANAQPFASSGDILQGIGIGALGGAAIGSSASALLHAAKVRAVNKSALAMRAENQELASFLDNLEASLGK